jgi:hypothetical protein
MQTLGVDRGMTLSRLTQNSSRAMLQNIVRDQIKMIDAAITTAHTSGFGRIEHELPTNFALNNMQKADAQLMVYSEVLLLLTMSEESGGKGFEHVKIDIAPAGNKAILIVQWINGIDNEEMSARKELIERYLMTRKKSKALN